MSVYQNAFKNGFLKESAEIESSELKATGEFPTWLNGTLLRNGPGAFKLEKQTLKHWFDGLAMLHRFSFSDGKIVYSNRFLDSKAVNSARNDGKISYSEFATDPCRNIFKKTTAVFDQKITDSAKVNIQKFSDRFLALGETPLQIQFDPKTLKKLGEFVYERHSMQHVTTVHPHIDSSNGNMYNLVTRFDRISEYRIMKIDSEGRQKIAARQKVTYPAYIHSWALTPNYFILAEYPFTVYPLKLLFQIRPFIENFKWQPHKPTKFYVFRRSDGEKVKTFETKAFFAFHHINAFESDNKIICDINTYENPDIINAFYLNRIKNETNHLPHGNITRFKFDLENGSVDRELLLNECIELVRYNEKYAMDGAYRYVYGVSVNKNKPQAFYNQLIKFDIASHETCFWHTDDCFPGEPVFVPSPDADAEDDGVIISVVLDGKNENSFLLILNARNFSEMARVEVPQAIMFGYHGAYYENV